jgi:citronellyl-CoA dehydrogenase
VITSTSIIRNGERLECFQHPTFRHFEDTGLLGITKPKTLGGLSLEFTFEVIFAEELSHIKTGGLSMAIAVQTDMCAPALAAHASNELCSKWLTSSIAGEVVGYIGVTEEGSGSDVANLRNSAQ